MSTDGRRGSSDLGIVLRLPVEPARREGVDRAAADRETRAMYLSVCRNLARAIDRLAALYTSYEAAGPETDARPR